MSTEKFDEIVKKIHDESNRQPEKMFPELGKYLLNEVCIMVNKTQYRIVECEIYYHGKRHLDPYVHGAIYKLKKRTQQLHLNRWYFNDGGIDITFGKESTDDPIYASVLIRSIKKFDTNAFINGPLNLVRELFFEVGDIWTINNFLSLQPFNKYDNSKIYSLVRFGLKPKKDLPEKLFYNGRYRYVAEIDNNYNIIKNKSQSTIIE